MNLSQPVQCALISQEQTQHYTPDNVRLAHTAKQVNIFKRSKLNHSTSMRSCRRKNHSCNLSNAISYSYSQKRNLAIFFYFIFLSPDCLCFACTKYIHVQIHRLAILVLKKYLCSHNHSHKGKHIHLHIHTEGNLQTHFFFTFYIFHWTHMHKLKHNRL